MFLTLLPATVLGTDMPAQKPNFLFYLADDVNYNIFGCYGGQNIKTPNIDKLASEGMRFTKAYCAVAMCGPFRAELYTGLYPMRTGVTGNWGNAKPGTKSIVHHLKDQGYRVGLVGKQHHGPASVYPFDEVGGKSGVKFMTADKNQPFCLIIASLRSHYPWPSQSVVDEKSIKLAPVQHDNPETRNVTARYLAGVITLDNQVGEMMETLEKNGLKDNTLVMFSSEQGWPFGFAKWNNYDLGVRTAFIARWPGKIKAGSVSDALVQMADVVPTFVEAAGGKIQPGQFDGRSFYRHLLGQEQSLRKYVYGMHNMVPQGNPYPIRYIRDEDYHYIWNLTPDEPYFQGSQMSKKLEWWPPLVEAAKKGDKDAIALMKRCQHRPEEELFKVDEDPYELNNLADNPELAEVKKRLRAELEHWMQEQGDPGASLDQKPKRRKRETVKK